MKKILLYLLIFSLLCIGAYATITSVTLNYPSGTVYNGSGSGNDVNLKLNATVVQTGPTNTTNVTFILTDQDGNRTAYDNQTINGTSTGDFTFTIAASSLANGTFTVIAQAHNSTNVITASHSNSSASTLVMDRTNPVITLNNPNPGATLTPSNSLVTFAYLTYDNFISSCSLVIDGATDSTDSSITNLMEQTITKSYTADATDTWAISCQDLAGNIITTSTRNFNVLASGAIIDDDNPNGGSQIENQPGQVQTNDVGAVITSPKEEKSNLLGWGIAAVIILVIGYFMFSKRK